ncbi:MAG: energy-coupling factor transporter transmembrane component T [Candidatus Izemoplasma sp.]
MNNIIIGQYIPGNSFLYKMDPRSKIIALMILMVSAFVLNDIFQISGMLVVVLIILRIGKIPISRILKGLRPLMFLLMFTFIFQILLNKTEPIIFNEVLIFSPINIGVVFLIILFWYFTKRFFPYRFLYFLMMMAASIYILINFSFDSTLFTKNLVVYEGGVMMALYIMVRLIVIVTLSTILTLTTKPTDLNLGLEYILKPLSIVRINTEEIALIISIALRYIPTLLDEANKIMLAQASRGVDFTEGKLKDKVMQIISLLVPMFIISFKRSDELANAMEARSFVPGKPRTRLHVLSWQSIDTISIAFSVIVFIFAIAILVTF